MPAKKALKEEVVEVQPATPAVPPAKNETSIAMLSMIFGLISMTGFGFLFGIPAIVLAWIALKRHYPERGLSITGLVTGIVSTVLSILFLVGMVLLFIWGANHPEEMERQNSPLRQQPENHQRFESSRT